MTLVCHCYKFTMTKADYFVLARHRVYSGHLHEWIIGEAYTLASIQIVLESTECVIYRYRQTY